MFRLTAISLLLLSSFVAAQDPKPAPVETTVPAERKMGLAKPLVLEADREVYGAELAGKPVVPLADVVKDPKAWNGKNVQVRGKIDGVCTKKGCWLALKDGTHKMRVGFTGYKFFVPFDVSDRDVAVEGTINVKVESEAERRHYAQDAGKSPAEIAKIVGDEVVLSFTADAVQIGKLPPLPKKDAAGEKSCCSTETGSGGCGAAGGCCGSKSTGEAKKGETPKNDPNKN